MFACLRMRCVFSYHSFFLFEFFFFCDYLIVGRGGGLRCDGKVLSRTLQGEQAGQVRTCGMHLFIVGHLAQ